MSPLGINTLPGVSVNFIEIQLGKVQYMKYT
jgi:hypothetical protein